MAPGKPGKHEFVMGTCGGTIEKGCSFPMPSESLRRRLPMATLAILPATFKIRKGLNLGLQVLSDTKRASRESVTMRLRMTISRTPPELPAGDFNRGPTTKESVD